MKTLLYIKINTRIVYCMAIETYPRQS